MSRMTMATTTPATLRDIETPALLLDLDVLGRNLARMDAGVGAMGLALRPHAK